MGNKIYIKACLFLIFNILSLIFCTATDYVPKSVMSEGKWVQLKITENAVYKLTYEQIKQMGFGDPAKIKIYGYGGWILDQDFRQPYIDDLPEVPVYLNKGSDGIFNAGDFLLFYGRGLTKWTYDATKDLFVHQNNPYSLFASYFVAENENGPAEMQQQSSYSETVASVDLFDDYLVHEKDLTAILHSGRELFGENFVSASSRDFTFTVPGITGDAGKVRLSFAAAPRASTPVSLSIGGTELIKANIEPVSSGSADYQKAQISDKTGVWAGAKSENITVRIQYYPGQSSVAYLNYFTLNMKRKLQFYNTGYTFFRDKNSRNHNMEYVVSNASDNRQIWNISDVQNIQRVQVQIVGNQMQFGAVSTGKVAEYVMVDPSQSFPTPQVVGAVANQNLHQLPQTEMIIIAPENYFNFAEQLAEKHREKQGLHVTVVRPEWIYNEFSSGTPDATAYRRFVKMFYDRATSSVEKPKYLLFYGDGHFNNRDIDPKRYLLTYQFEESLDERSSYGTDDYFGFLDDSEGISLSRDVLDIGIGRFPVSSSEQAANALAKVSAYMDDANGSSWKNTVIFTSDDTGATDSFCGFGKQANALARIMETNHPQYMVVKSYMDAFLPAVSNGKKTYPEAKKRLMNTLKEGCFLFNYTGHGNPSSMSAEDMMNIVDIRRMTFPYLPLWITATCDFGRYDDDTGSAGEEVFLNPQSAGIALITTTRVVYSDSNQSLNLSLIRNIFGKKSDGTRPALGDIIRESKASMSTDANKLNFILLGDPALQLNYPEGKVQLETINGQAIDELKTLNIKALEQITLEGAVTDASGNVMDDFNGILQTSIFDGIEKQLSVTNKPETKPEDVKSEEVSDGSFIRWAFDDYPNLVFRGNGVVENGRFSLSLTIPLDIAYRDALGKMNFYAYDPEQNRDAAGNFQKYSLLGIADYPWNEDGPEIQAIYLNSPQFKDGDTVNETPYFYAEVYDSDGLNYTGSGMGHDITICIDRNPSWKWSYPKDKLFYPSGKPLTADTVSFALPELPAGDHVLDFTVWDILNNSTQRSLHFKVVKGYQPAVYSLTAYPNPVRESTTFQIQHNRPGDESLLEVEIRVFDLSGRTIWTHSETGYSAFGRSFSVLWDLNGKVKPGLYLYQAVFKTKGGKETTKAERIIVL